MKLLLSICADVASTQWMERPEDLLYKPAPCNNWTQTRPLCAETVSFGLLSEATSRVVRAVSIDAS